MGGCGLSMGGPRVTITKGRRVSNRKGLSMQNKFISVLWSRSTLGKIETTLQIGYALGKVREKAILNHIKAQVQIMAT